MEDIRKGTCPLCRHNEIVEGPVRDLNPLLVENPLWPYHRYSQQAGSTRAAFAYTASSSPERVLVHGLLKRYACLGCGYTQTFCEEPQSIPIDDAHETRLIKGAELAGPYR